MEKREYHIMISVKTPNGYDCFGQYTLGHDRRYADAIFSKLEGSSVITEQAKLHLDLMETANELPVKVKTICCTLEEFGFNAKLIARELFRKSALNELS